MKELKMFIPMTLLALLLAIGCYKAIQSGGSVPVLNVDAGHLEEMEVALEQKEVNKQFINYGPDVMTFNRNKIPNLSYKIEGVKPEGVQSVFPRIYSEVEGILTFRGNHLRNQPAFGTVPSNPSQLAEAWSFTTKRSPRWGGGAGWTGQPAIIKWDSEVVQMMNINEKFKKAPSFTEVIYGSLDGRVYFFELSSGEQSRPPIDIGNPIKGSVSIDPRGYPLLYVGQGIPQTSKTDIGLRIFSLIDGKQLSMVKGIDSFAFRKWGAFDSSPLINRETDTMIVGGENGIFYHIKLNTRFSKEKRLVSVNPAIMKYRYLVKGNVYHGIENSIAAYKNVALFADNGGSLQAIDTVTNRPIWVLNKTDDTDATIVIDEENYNTPYFYTGTEVDKQGEKGVARLRKINGFTGNESWSVSYPAWTVRGKKPINGGLLATPIVGKKEMKDLVIFTIARAGSPQAGIMVALHKQTGKEVWRWQMPKYAWSSAVDVYDKNGKAYIIQGDSRGTLYLLSGTDGKLISKVELGYNIEASPAVYNDMLVVATRAQKIYGVKILPQP